MDFLERHFELDRIRSRIMNFLNSTDIHDKNVLEILSFKDQVYRFCAKYSYLVQQPKRRGHYHTCIWSKDNVTEGPDTCACVTVSMSAGLIRQNNSNALHILKMY